MKKIMTVILFLTIISINLNAFNYDRYNVLTLDEFIAYIEKCISDAPPGLTYFNNYPFVLHLKLPSYPDLSNDVKYKTEIKFFNDTLGVQDKVFGYVMELKIKDYNLIIVNQIKLAEYLINDVKINEDIGIYCILGYYNFFGKKIVCLMNAFNTINDYKRRNVKPIWEK